MGKVDIILFSATTEKFESELWSYLCRQAYLPTKFVERKNKASNISGYVPMYVFQASYTANWNASFGFNRQEHYTEYRTEVINNVRRTTPVTRTKTVTDWRPANGTTRGRAMFAAYAGSIMPPLAIELLEEVQLRNIVSSSAGSIKVPVEPFSASSERVWNGRGQQRLDQTIDMNVRSHGQGDKQDNWSWNAESEYSSSELLMPIEGVEIRFGEKTYSFWIDGSSPTRIRHDELPRDSGKSREILLGFVPAVVAALMLVVTMAAFNYRWSVVVLELGLCVAAVLGGLKYKNTLEARSRDALMRAAFGPD